MYSDKKELYEFGNFRLDVNEHRLSYADGTLAGQLPEKAFQTLVLLVRKAGNLVNKQELLAAVWADAVVEENNLDKAIHTIRHVLGEKPGEQKYIETIRKHGYRFVAPVNTLETPFESALDRVDNGEFLNERKGIKPVGEPTISTLTTRSGAFVVSAKWSHEDDEKILPANGNHHEDTPVSYPLEHLRANRTGRAKWIALTFLLALSIGALSFAIYRSTDSTAGGGPKSIAVFPLNPIDRANRNDLYEIGIADSLIHQLGAAKGIVVRPLSSTRKYTEIEPDPIAAGREQKVDHVLASNYQVADGKFRLTAQLINVASGQVEDSYKVETTAGDVFAIQDAVAAAIGNRLIARFGRPTGPTTKRGTNNEEAYRLYLQGRNLTMKRSGGAHKEAIEHFEQAIKIDPNYALAYARMAHAYWAGVATADRSTHAEKARGFVKKALELDPNLAEALATRGFIGLAYDWKYEAAERDLLRAIELEPNNDTAHWLYGLLLTNRGLFDEGLREMEAALAIDPGAVLYMAHRGRILYYARRYDEAITQYQHAIDLDDRFQATYAWMVRVYETNGDYETAFRFFLKQEERSPRKDQLEHYQKAYETSGWLGVRQVADTNGRLFDLARLHSLRGEKDAAFENLDKAVEERHWLMTTMNVEPAFDNLRDDRRFAELLTRVGYK